MLSPRLNYDLTVVVVCAMALAMSIEAAQVRAAAGRIGDRTLRLRAGKADIVYLGSGTLYHSYHSASPITGSLAYPLPASCGMNSAILDFAPAFVSVSTNHW